MFGEPAGVLDVLQTAGEFALRVGEGFSMFCRDDRGEFVGVLDEELAKGEQDVRALGERRFAPRERSLVGGGDDAVDERGLGHGNQGGHLSRGWIEDRHFADAGNSLTADKMGN